MCTFPFINNQYEAIFDLNIKMDTSSGDISENVYHCLDSFEKFHKNYITMPSESLNYSLLEESFFITVRSLPGFIN